MSLSLKYRTISTLIGELTLIRNPAGLHAIQWDGWNVPKRAELDVSDALLLTAEKQLREYFLGQRQAFDLLLAPQGTDFQKSVWNELRKIPFGQPRSYGQIAKGLGSPQKARAVGGANNKNPLPIVVPCHRVIGSDGKLVGFAGGLNVKQRLLDLESRALIESSCKTFASPSGMLNESISIYS